MQFRGQYDFLSNMYPSEIDYHGVKYSCVEAAFQAQKDLSRCQEFSGISGKEAKSLGRRVSLRADWNEARIPIMKEILQVKFQDAGLKQKLLSVSEPIVEDNTWGDKFWGKCNGIGENHLGQLLMELQKEFQREFQTENIGKNLPRKSRQQDSREGCDFIEVPVGDFSSDRYYPDLQDE